MKNKIVVLLTGQLRYFNKKNYEILKKNFKKYDLIFFIASWKNEEKILKKKI